MPRRRSCGTSRPSYPAQWRPFSGTEGRTIQPGATIKQTDAVTRRAADIVSELPDVRHVYSSVSSASSNESPQTTTTTDVAAATLVVVLTPIEERNYKQSKIENTLRQALSSLPGVRVAVDSGRNGTKLDITLASDDPDTLAGAGAAMEEQLRTLSGIGAVTSTASRQAPELQITPDLCRTGKLQFGGQTLRNHSLKLQSKHRLFLLGGSVVADLRYHRSPQFCL